MFLVAVYCRGCFQFYIYAINYLGLKSLIHIHWYFVLLRIRQLMDLGKNIWNVSSFLHVENLYCSATTYAGVTRSNICLPHFPIAVLLQWKRLQINFCSCRNKQANRTQLHEWGSGSEEIISAWLVTSNTLKREEENKIFFISQKIQRCRTGQKSIIHSYSWRRTFHHKTQIACTFQHIES